MSKLFTKSEVDALVERITHDRDMLQEGNAVLQEEMSDANDRATAAEKESAKHLSAAQDAIGKADDARSELADAKKQLAILRTSETKLSSDLKASQQATDNETARADRLERDVRIAQDELKASNDAKQRAEIKAETEERLRLAAERTKPREPARMVVAPTSAPVYEVMIHRTGDGSLGGLTLTPKKAH